MFQNGDYNPGSWWSPGQNLNGDYTPDSWWSPGQNLELQEVPQCEEIPLQQQHMAFQVAPMLHSTCDSGLWSDRNFVIAGYFSLIDYQGLILAGLSNAYTSVPPVAGVETESEQSCGKGKHLVHFLPPCSSGYFFGVKVMLYGL